MFASVSGYVDSTSITIEQLSSTAQTTNDWRVYINKVRRNIERVVIYRGSGIGLFLDDGSEIRNKNDGTFLYNGKLIISDEHLEINKQKHFDMWYELKTDIDTEKHEWAKHASMQSAFRIIELRMELLEQQHGVQ